MEIAVAGASTPVLEHCPWCDSVISHAKFLEVQERIREQERKRAVEIEAKARRELQTKFQTDLTRVKADAERHLAQAVAKAVAPIRTELAQAQGKLRSQEELRKQILAESDKKHQTDLAKQRQVLERDRDQAVLKVRAEVARDREGLQKKIAELERKVQNKTAHELGDGAELDLYDVLRAEFPRDHITRVGKGEPGADIHHEVLHKGQSCGLIVIDSKNRKGWQNGYVSKLREVQVAAKAEHAILASPVFPSGTKELCIRDGVIIVTPARAAFIVQLLRVSMERMHVHGMSMKERARKMGELYRYITSSACARRFEEAKKLADDISNIDVEETKEHRRVWEKRGRLIVRTQGALRDLDTEIMAIVEGSDDPEDVA